MPASQEKIITKLRERRQIEADLRQMFAASSELDFRLQAQRIAALGSEVVPIIVGNLDRADARMLVVHRATGSLEHAHVRNLPEILARGDCLVLNDTRVIPARLEGCSA